jgi:hypothetical protein
MQDQCPQVSPVLVDSFPFGKATSTYVAGVGDQVLGNLCRGLYTLTLREQRAGDELYVKDDGGHDGDGCNPE